MTTYRYLVNLVLKLIVTVNQVNELLIIILPETTCVDIFLTVFVNSLFYVIDTRYKIILRYRKI